MKPLVTAVVVSLAFVLVVPAQAQAMPCYKNGKAMPIAHCAYLNMQQYANARYINPRLTAHWVAVTKYGRWHTRWRIWVLGDGLFHTRGLVLSARQRCGHIVVWDHRRRKAWASGKC